MRIRLKSPIITDLNAMNREQKAILASTPGHILKQKILGGFGLSQLELSKRTGIPRSTVNEIVKGKRPINGETAYALGLFFPHGAAILDQPPKPPPPAS